MRLIDADALIDDMVDYVVDGYAESRDDFEEYTKMVQTAPTIDAVEVVHGEWKGYNADKEDWLRKDGTPIFLICNKCYGTVINNGSAHWNYCPNCGARMKGADDGNK